MSTAVEISNDLDKMNFLLVIYNPQLPDVKTYTGKLTAIWQAVSKELPELAKSLEEDDAAYWEGLVDESESRTLDIFACGSKLACIPIGPASNSAKGIEHKFVY